MELSIGEMLLIALAIVVLFGPDKLPSIARELGQGVRKMRGAVEDIKTEILKETDNPVSEIKREIEKVKSSAFDFKLEEDRSAPKLASEPKDSTPEVKPHENPDHDGPVSR